MSKLLAQKRNRRHDVFNETEDVNPMNYMNNLSDVMLVLAVGIMLALVLAWDVDIAPQNSGLNEAQLEGEEQELQIDDQELEQYGTVYRDKEGNFYVLEE